MNYYERHLGDYLKDTISLSMLEEGAYNRLLDYYYSKEHGIAADKAYRIARATTKDERAAVDVVLAEYFHLKDGVWIKNRCEEEIERAQGRIAAAQDNGRKGGRPKKPTGLFANGESETQQKPTGLFLGSNTETQPLTQKKALQTPDSRLQSPEKNKKANALAEARAVAGLNVEEFDRWIAYRAERKPAIKPPSMKAAAEELAKFGTPEQQATVVQHSIANGYQGLFAPKVNGNGMHASQAPPVRYRTADEIEAEERARGDWDAQH